MRRWDQLSASERREVGFNTDVLRAVHRVYDSSRASRLGHTEEALNLAGEVRQILRQIARDYSERN